MNYYEKHIGDYIRDTVSLTMLEDGAYNRLIDQVYQSERPLPLDRKMIYRLARATAAGERKAVDFVIATFFRQTDSGYVQKRIEAEIERYQEKQRKAKASADARWNRTKQDANASQTHDASDMRTHSEGNAHQSPVTSHQSPDLKATTTPLSGGATVPEREDQPQDDHPKTAPLPPREDAPESYDPAIAMAVALRKLGVNAQFTHPAVQDWTTRAVPMDILQAAVAKARETKGKASIPPNYLVGIVEELLHPPAKAEARPIKPQGDDWFRSKSGIERKGKELGMFARGNESHDDFKDRIFAKLRQQGGAR